ncbi:MAG: hypothetical protein KGN36_11450 [Acidobacteriota bacterium]|nr:hypothetical protein [Acidobacteriota bacterium]
MYRLVCLTCVLALGAFAQQTPTIPMTANVQSTGMVGIGDGQTARLNLLNPGVPAPAMGVICAASAAFVDALGGTVKSAMLSVPPGQSGALEIRSDTELKLMPGDRREIRGTVAVPGIVPLAGTTAMPVFACSLIATLEVYDTASGRTQAVLERTFLVPGVLK